MGLWRIFTHTPQKGQHLEKILVTWVASKVKLVSEKHPQPAVKANLDFFPAHYPTQWWNEGLEEGDVERHVGTELMSAYISDPLTCP